jgi:hypothetical protein
MPGSIGQALISKALTVMQRAQFRQSSIPALPSVMMDNGVIQIENAPDRARRRPHPFRARYSMDIMI